MKGEAEMEEQCGNTGVTSVALQRTIPVGRSQWGLACTHAIKGALPRAALAPALLTHSTVRGSVGRGGTGVWKESWFRREA